LSGARRHQERSHRRDSAHQRPAPAAALAADLRVRDQRRPPRHRKQTGIPESARVLRAAAAGSVGAVPEISRRDDRYSFDFGALAPLSLFVSVFVSLLVSLFDAAASPLLSDFAASPVLPAGVDDEESDFPFCA